MKKKSVCRVGTVLAAGILAANMGNTVTKSVYASTGQWRAYSLSVDAQRDFLYGDFDFDAEDEEDYPSAGKLLKNGKLKTDPEDETEDSKEAEDADPKESEAESEVEGDCVEAEPVPAPEEPGSCDSSEGSGDFGEESSASDESGAEDSAEPDAEESGAEECAETDAEESGAEECAEPDGEEAESGEDAGGERDSAKADAEQDGERADEAGASGENAKEAWHEEMPDASGDDLIAKTGEGNGAAPEADEEQVIGASDKDASVSPGMNNMIETEQSSTDAVPDAVAVTEEIPEEETVGAAVAGRNTTSAENTVNTSSPGRPSVMTQTSTYSSPGATQMIGNTGSRKTPVRTSASPSTGTVSGGSSSDSSSGSSSSGGSSSGSSSSGSSSSGSSSSGKSSKSSGAERTAPKTGDTSNVFLHFSSAAASLGVIFESFLMNERRKHKISRKRRDK